MAKAPLVSTVPNEDLQPPWRSDLGSQHHVDMTGQLTKGCLLGDPKQAAKGLLVILSPRVCLRELRS